MKVYAGYAPNDEAVIMEMNATGITEAGVDVPVDPKLLQELADGDDDPMFVTIEVINEGRSGNGRLYTREAIDKICRQINEERPNGYLGHLSLEERKTKYPAPQTMWLGAVAKEVNGKYRLFAKGYVLPDATSLRTYLRKAKIAGKNVAVSIYGKVHRVARGVADMTSLALESIDWVRQGSEGVRNSGVFVIASEMQDDDSSNLDDKGDDMTKEEALASATASDLKEHVNPEVVSEMLQEAVSASEAEHEAVVSEMLDIKQALGLDTDSESKPAQVIAEMQSELRDMQLDNELRDKVESKAARKVIKTMVVAEMQADETVGEAVDKVLASEDGKAVIQEMLEKAPRIAPQVDKPVVVARKYTTKR